jgi:hypothetical protein
MMKRLIAATACLAGLILSAPAQAGVYSDDLAKCLVKSTGEADRIKLIQFMFAAIGANPALKSMSNVSDTQRSDLVREFAHLEERLLMVDCRTEAVAALKNEGQSVIESSFGVLGGSAMRGMMSDPTTQSTFRSLGADLDKPKWAALLKEGGVDTGAAATTPAAK